jgi:hypothetical protein
MISAPRECQRRIFFVDAYFCQIYCIAFAFWGQRPTFRTVSRGGAKPAIGPVFVFHPVSS